MFLFCFGVVVFFFAGNYFCRLWKKTQKPQIKVNPEHSSRYTVDTEAYASHCSSVPVSVTGGLKGF